jgi:hypothetical protein
MKITFKVMEKEMARIANTGTTFYPNGEGRAVEAWSLTAIKRVLDKLNESKPIRTPKKNNKRK